MSTHHCIGSPCWLCHPELGPKVESYTPPTWVIVVPRALPSSNRAAHNRSITASHVYRRERREWAALVALLARRAGVTLVSPLFQPKRRVVVTRLYGKSKRRIDTVNAWGGCKLLFDILQPPRDFKRRAYPGGPLLTFTRPGASVIVDDSDEWLEAEVLQERADDGACATRLEISDVRPGGVS